MPTPAPRISGSPIRSSTTSSIRPRRRPPSPRARGRQTRARRSRPRLRTRPRPPTRRRLRPPIKSRPSNPEDHDMKLAQPAQVLSAALLLALACVVTLGAGAYSAYASVITETSVDGVVHGFNDRVVRVITTTGTALVPR